MKKILFLSFLLTFTVSFSQSSKELDKKWVLARGHYGDGNYDMPVILFQSLTPENSDNPYVEYANYYTALCYFNLGKLKRSREYLLQLNNKYPMWEKRENADYLLANIEFEHEKYSKALSLLQNQEGNNVSSMKFHYLPRVKTVTALRDLYAEYPNDNEVGTVLAYRLATQFPLMENDKKEIYELIDKHNIKGNKLKSHLESSDSHHFKDTFQVGLIFPFNLYEIKKYKPVRRNQFALDYYWGLQLALDSLTKQNIHIKLKAYDTENDTLETKRILNRKELKDMDMIIGSMYKKNMSYVSAFCNENQIVCFNPLSNQSQTIQDSGFVYMQNPSYEAIGRSAAKFVMDSFADKKIVVLSFNTAKDTTITNAFISALKDSGITVEHEVIVEKGKDVLYPLSKVKSEDAGVIFAPSYNTSIASSLTSWLIIREIEVPVIGNASWFNSQEFNIKNFNKREAYFFDEGYKQELKDTTFNFDKLYFKRFNIPPSSYAYKGYEMGMFMGYNLNKYGKYFNQALWNMEAQEGVFYPYFNYNHTYDNQFVPILKLEDFQLIPGNFGKIEETEDESREE